VGVVYPAQVPRFAWRDDPLTALPVMDGTEVADGAVVTTPNDDE
jgi:hypothetical protein